MTGPDAPFPEIPPPHPGPPDPARREPLHPPAEPHPPTEPYPWTVPQRPAPGAVVIPGATEAREDLSMRLLDRRIVMVSGVLDDATAADGASRLMLLDATGDEPVQLQLSCPDGALEAAAALADTVELAGVEVRAVVRGVLGGAALWPLVVADRRTAAPSARFDVREPRAELAGPSSQVAGAAEAFDALVDRLRARIAEVTGRPVGTVAADLRRGLLLDAREARDYGLVEDVAGRRALAPTG